MRLEARFAMINSGGQRDVGVGQQDVRGDNIEVGDRRRPDRQRFALDDGGVNAALGLDLRIIFQKNLGAVGLAVNVDKQYFAASTG
jgi:hypothetical protein